MGVAVAVMDPLSVVIACDVLETVVDGGAEFGLVIGLAGVVTTIKVLLVRTDNVVLPDTTVLFVLTDNVALSVYPEFVSNVTDELKSKVQVLAGPATF